MDEVVKEIIGDTPFGETPQVTDDDRATLLPPTSDPTPRPLKPRNRHVISLVWMLLVRKEAAVLLCMPNFAGFRC